MSELNLKENDVFMHNGDYVVFSRAEYRANFMYETYIKRSGKEEYIGLILVSKLNKVEKRSINNMSELKYRVNFIPAMEVSHDSIKVRSASLEQARQELDIIANYTIFLHDNGMMNDYSNIGWIEKLVDGEWVEVDEE